jgi:hypothetical protein
MSWCTGVVSYRRHRCSRDWMPHVPALQEFNAFVRDVTAQQADGAMVLRTQSLLGEGRRITRSSKHADIVTAVPDIRGLKQNYAARGWLTR